jgi:hypothetical protein
LATFDYLKAIWKNGPGVVSDAPAWVLAEIERELRVWMGAHEHRFVGVHLCAQSNLTLGILVSPSASGDDGSLEDARYGSFIHVFATDHPDRATLCIDEVRVLFESSYGAPISDGAVRQQRNFMLLDFPYHQDLAKDLFMDKSRVEGGLDLAAPVLISEFEETLADPVPRYVPDEDSTSRPLVQGSLSSLLTHHDPVIPPGGEDGLPFDQGLSYAEVIAGLRERLYERPSPVEPEHAQGDPVVPELPAPSSPSTVDVLPLDQPAPVMRAVLDVEAVEAEAGVADEEETELRNFEAIPVLERDAPLAPRRAGSPIFAIAGLLVAGLLVGGFIVFRLWERAPADASLAERAAPVAVLPDVSARLPARELTGLDRGTDTDMPSQIDAVDMDVSERQPKAILPALEVATDQAEPDFPLIEPVMPLVVEEAEAELPVLAAVKMESAPDVVARGATRGLAPALVMAHVAVVTEPELAIQEATSSASDERDPAIGSAFDVDVADTRSEPSGGTLQESAAARLGETPATSSAEAEAEATAPSIVVERTTKQRDGRRKRERNRIMGQINRYR